MADQNEEAMNNLATGVAADHQAEKSGHDCDHRGPVKPQDAEPGDSWFNTEDRQTRYLWGNGRWYLKQEGEEVERMDAGAGAPIDRGPAEAVTPEPDSGPEPEPEPAEEQAEDVVTPEMENSSFVTTTAAMTAANVEEVEAGLDNSGAIEIGGEGAELHEEAQEVLADLDGEDDGQDGDEFEEIGPAFHPDAFTFELDAGQLVPDVRDMMLQRMKDMPKPWHKMSEAEQRDWSAVIGQDIEHVVGIIFEFAAAGGEKAVRCKLDSYAEKKGGLAVSMTVEAFGEEESAAAVLFLHRQRGQHVMLRAAGIDDYRGDRDAVVQPDQAQIDFDAEVPDEEAYRGNNADLAGDDEEPAPGTSGAAMKAMDGGS